MAPSYLAGRIHGAAAQPGVRGDPLGHSQRTRRRRRHRSARRDRRRLSRRVASRNARGPREARRIRAEPLPARPEARVAYERRLRSLHDDHHGHDRPAPRARREELPAGAHLADRIRLPDEPARPRARHLLRAPGAVRRRSRLRRIQDAARRPADSASSTRTSRHCHVSRAASSQSTERPSRRMPRSSCRSQRRREPARGRLSGDSSGPRPRRRPDGSSASSEGSGGRSRQFARAPGASSDGTARLRREAGSDLQSGSLTSPAMTIT